MERPTDHPKAIKRRIRELAGLAYERALAAALGELEKEFASWRQGRCDAFQLEERIQKFHDGVARELWKKFSPQPAFVLDLSVAEAIATRAISIEEAGPEVLEALRTKIEVVDDMLTSDLVRRAAEEKETR
jgi:hypothetical protein